MNKISENICDAIEIILNKAIASADFDKTILATIVSCVDATIGKYQVRYQDSTFYAYTNNIDVTYSDGSTVYILVPGGDMGKDKTILGTTKKLGLNYISATTNEDRYNIVGNNCLSSIDSFGLCSYKAIDEKILYEQGSVNNVNLNLTSVNEYIKNSGYIVCGANIKTTLSPEQRVKGNYGIIFELEFEDNAKGELISRYYIVDINKMVGNPYKLVNYTRQYAVFKIDNKNFKAVKSIKIFSKDFPNTREYSAENDIFFKDIELYGAEMVAPEELDSYSLSFLTPNGTYFIDDVIDELILQAQVKVKGKLVDNNSQSLSYYWFKEDAGISYLDAEYNKYGGAGWRCLNDSNVISAEAPPVVEWVPASSEWKIERPRDGEASARQVKYKCVALYDGTTISKTIVIKNLSQSALDINIVSSNGTKFYFDMGETTLACTVDGESPDYYEYLWAVTDVNGEFTEIADTSSSIKVLARDISARSTYQCTVYSGDKILGTASIVIVNSLEPEGTWSLVITNGTNSFKYNEAGVSPASSAVDNPIAIPALGFIIYDNNGNAITDEETLKRNCKSIRWLVPKVNTMLEVLSEPTGADLEGLYHYVDNSSTLAYSIARMFNINKTNNDIQLQIVYGSDEEINLSASTSLIFTKEGDVGTNGTEYYCKIAPNAQPGYENVKYPVVIENADGSFNFNYLPIVTNKYLKVQFWYNENKIFEDTTSSSSLNNSNLEGKEYKIKWEILRNKYNGAVADESAFEIGSENGELEYKGFIDATPANIIKATVTYEGKEYYATMPIITIKKYDDTVNFAIDDNIGFKYVTYNTDGTKPKYVDKDFEIDTKLPCSWSYIGNLEETYVQPETTNRRSIKPIKEFDGLSKTNAVLVTIDTDKVKIHMPIHMYLNKYGQAALNSWDGNSIELSEDGGYILSPQVGAGQKNSDNSFTGVLIGKVKEASDAQEKVGLLGYSSGIRSIFLDAETGKAEFGSVGKGQIVIDPTNDKAQLYSGNYSASDKTGMMIDLTTPEIKFGSGKFTVNSEGIVTATDVDLTGKITATSGEFTGTIYAQSGTIGSGSSKINIGKSADSSHSAVYSGNHSTLDSTSSGFYIGTDGLSIGSNFKVTNGGILTAKDVILNGVSIDQKFELVKNSVAETQFRDAVADTIVARNILANYVTTGVLNAEVATLENLIAKKASVNDLNATNARIEELSVANITADRISSGVVNGKSVGWNNVSYVTNAYINSVDDSYFKTQTIVAKDSYGNDVTIKCVTGWNKYPIITVNSNTLYALCAK